MRRPERRGKSAATVTQGGPLRIIGFGRSQEGIAKTHVALHGCPADVKPALCQSCLARTLIRRIQMSLQTHLAELERKHRQLEEAIAQAVASPSSDDLGVAELKRKKLLLKDEIERVRQTMPTPTLH
jgi:hypothetical protein